VWSYPCESKSSPAH